MGASFEDTRGTVARTVRLSITGECNLECFYCRPLGRSRDLFETKSPIQHSDVTKLIKILGEKGVTRVVIGGGEPLLRKDAPNFVKSAFAHRAIDDVRLVTNGTYLKTHADGLRKMGLRKVDIKVDSLRYERYQTLTKRDDLFRVMDGVDKVEKLNYPDIRLNVFLLRGVNEDEIVDFARFTKDHRVHVRFIEYDPHFTNGAHPGHERLGMSIVEAKRYIDNYQKLTQIPEFDVDSEAAVFQFLDSEGKVSFLSKVELERECSVPTVTFNVNGIFYNEAVPNRGYAILADLRRDAKEGRLHRTIEKVLMLHTTVAPKKKAPEPVVATPRSKIIVRPKPPASRHASARR